jgi:hypothetical protein
LAYADWLQEQGYEDYARYIRLSIRIAREMQHPDERARLRLQRNLLGQEIMQAHPRAFTEGGALLHYASSDFGIATPYHETDADEFLKNWPHWWPFVWPKALILRAVTGYELALGMCDYLRRITSLECEGDVDGLGFEVAREDVSWYPVSGMLLRAFINNPRLAQVRALKVEPIQATAVELLKFGESQVASQLEALHLWVQFPDGSREDLRAEKGFLKEQITDFVTEHILRFRSESAG